ncbi:hypothetical protein CPT_Moabite_004 [Serratia phage Moabite]|uniref:Uncharacterized protein n=1 Tax=Serratia phage Moabite TaxID=2587814 RepID=A0A4Y5TNW3_9CAUD|nr:hypothetical protein HWC48_gp004 [Serratia phage Moabite]QDB71036.1 hypothetical protein CPT_Moabite_004 [Serratia phage Moabite]
MVSYSKSYIPTDFKQFSSLYNRGARVEVIPFVNKT